MSLHPRGTPLATRLLSRVEKREDGCWIWLGNKTPRGYGAFTSRVNGHYTNTHRLAYQLFVGPIPAGLHIDHLCRNRACCNPEHLEAVTHQENCRRGVPFRVRPDHCVHGHEFTPENTHTKDGQRICRACGRDRIGRFRAKAKAA